MPEPDYTDDLYFEPVTLEGGIEKIMGYLKDIETCIENLPDGLITGEEKIIDVKNQVTNNNGQKAEATVKVGIDGYKVGVDKKSSSDDIREGQSVTYTLKISNTGKETTKVDVKDILPVDKNGNVIDSVGLNIETGELIQY